MKSKYDICFVGLKCYDLLSNAPVPRYLGGIEKQLVALARTLIKEQFKVAFITYDHGQPTRTIHGGIPVYKSFSPDEGMPGLRFIHPRMTKLWSAMRKADASIYVQMGAGSETGSVAIGSSWFLHGKRSFVFCTASDSDCDKQLPVLDALRERVLYRYGLRHAYRVITQTQSQRIMLSDSFGIASAVIPMPFSDEDAMPMPAVSGGLAQVNENSVLWVGRICKEKRFEWLLDLAERCPEMIFNVVGTANQESKYTKQMQERASRIKNVCLHGRISEERLQALYLESKILCCTSLLEGFPTTFLEAWSMGIPIVTSFDPDGVIAAEGLGSVKYTLDGLEESLHGLIESPDEWEKASKSARQYYLDHHSAEAAGKNFGLIFSEVLGA